jgi:hypothetical protein
MSVSLCCCNQATRIKFGFARHRRFGFIPRFALLANWGAGWPFIFATPQFSFPVNWPSRAAADISMWSWYDVYSTLTITERATYSGDSARNHFASWTGTINRKGGKLTESSSLPTLPNGFSQSPSAGFVAMPDHVGTPLQFVPSDYAAVITTTPTALIFRDSYSYVVRSGGVIIDSGLFSRELIREVSGLVTSEMMEDDVEELLDAVDFRTLDFVPSGTSGETARAAEYSVNGDIVLTTLDDRLLPITKLTGETTLSPARNQSNLTGVGHPALWAGWTLNPIDIPPEQATAFGTGIDSRTRYLTGAQLAQQSDRFEVLGAKAFIERPPGALYARRTGSEYHQRMGPDSCANLTPEIAGADPFLLGATRADELRHPGVQSVRPWRDFSGGAFLQVSGTPC